MAALDLTLCAEVEVFISLLTLLLFRSCLLLPFGIIRRFLVLYPDLSFLFSCLKLMHAMSLLLVPVGVVACSCFISYYPCHILYVILRVYRIFNYIYIYIYIDIYKSKPVSRTCFFASMSSQTLVCQYICVYVYTVYLYFFNHVCCLSFPELSSGS